MGDTTVKYHSLNKPLIGDVGSVDNGEIWEDERCIYLEGYAIISIEYYDKLIAFKPPTMMVRFKSLFVK